MAYISAWVSGPLMVTYKDEDGSQLTKKGGSRAWRNTNPGNISKGSFAEAHGAIGGDTRFAIFPDEDTGLKAIGLLFQTASYRNLTLEHAIFRYAPPNENDSSAYVHAITAEVGVSRDTLVRDLTTAQLDHLAQGIKRHEGWTPGTETT